MNADLIESAPPFDIAQGRSVDFYRWVNDNGCRVPTTFINLQREEISVFFCAYLHGIQQAGAHCARCATCTRLPSTIVFELGPGGATE